MDTNNPTFCFNDDHCHWQMSRWEKYTLSMLVSACRPDVSIEVGTFGGGSLQILAKHSQKVYSIDIDTECHHRLKAIYSNVDFMVGDSHIVLQELLLKLSLEQTSLGFVIIDGDHTAAGVTKDINHVLQFQPLSELVILMHDSFNPECRRGILAADWKLCPYVHYVEIDFVPGAFHAFGFDAAEPRSMWGGFAMAKLRSTMRQGELIVRETQQATFEILRAQSCHMINSRNDNVYRQSE